MDKNTLTGLMLIGAILLGFSYFNTKELKEQQEAEISEHELVKDSAQKQLENIMKHEGLEEKSVSNEITASSLMNSPSFMLSVPEDVKADSLKLVHYADSVATLKQLVAEEAQKNKMEGEYGIFYPSAEAKQEYFTLENDKLIVTLTNKGGRIANVKLKKYQSYDDYMNSEDSIPVQLFDEQTSNQSLQFLNNGKMIDTKNLFFKGELTTVEDEQILTFTAPTNDPNKYLQYTYKILKGDYDVDFQINYVNLQSDINLGDVKMNWAMQGLSTEKLTSDERQITCVMFRPFDEKRDYIRERGSDEVELESPTNWIAYKHKFFTSALIIADKDLSEGTLAQTQLEGDKYTIAYNADLKLPARSVIDLKFFFGPNDNELLSSFDNGMDDIINHGWGIFGYVNKWMIRPIFNVINSLGFNLGLVIILVTLIVKIIILPLTYKNYVSSAKMRVLKPEVEEINERMKDADAMKRQQEVSKLYSQTGVNPMAGCVPMLIQMPILLAVFRFFPASIDLRHAKFLWAEDLSSYESVMQLPFTVPLGYGDHVSLFAILMAISTLIYTKMNSGQMAQPTQPGMPNMNIIMYMMPFMMLFFFNSYSSGLSFYYLCGNLMNIGIMFAIKTYMIDEDKIKAQLADNKKKPPKKKSKFQQRMDEMVKQQQADAKAKKK